MNDLTTPRKAEENAVELWEASQRRYLRFTLWRSIRDSLSNTHFLRAILCLFTVVPFYAVLCNSPQLPGFSSFSLPQFGNRLFAERAINILLTGGALANGTPLALGLIPLFPLLRMARTQTMLRGRPSLRTYLFAVVLALLGTIILLRWYSVNGIMSVAGFDYLVTIALLVAGSILILSIHAVLATTLRVGLFETNMLLYVVRFFRDLLSSPDAWTTEWSRSFFPCLIAGAIFLGVTLWRRKIRLLYIGQGLRRLQEGIAHISKFSPRFGWILLSVYFFAWFVVVLFSASIPGGIVLAYDEWSPLVLTLSLGLYILLFMACFRWKHIFYPESPEDLAYSLETHQFLMKQPTSIGERKDESIVRPGTQTVAVLTTMETDTLRVTIGIFIIIIVAFAFPTLVTGQPCSFVSGTVQPLLLTTTLLGSVRFLSRSMFALRERTSPQWLGSQLASRRDIWDNLKEILRAFELQGLPIQRARQELRAAADTNFLGKIQAVRRILSLLRATESEMSDSDLSKIYRNLKLSTAFLTGLLVAVQFVLIACLVWACAVLLGFSFDTSSRVGVLASLGIIAFQEVLTRIRVRSR